METETQNNTPQYSQPLPQHNAPEYTAPQPHTAPKTPKKFKRYIPLTVAILVFILSIGVVYAWQQHKINALNAKLSNYQTALVKNSKLSLDNLNARMALPNIVVDTAKSPADLIAFLGSDNTGCYKDSGNGYYKIVAQSNNQFAKMEYGCTTKDGTTPAGSTAAYILAKKVDNKWSLINPTNEWVVIAGQSVPSCAMVNDNKVSKQVTPQCWSGPVLTGSGSYDSKNYTVIAVTNT